MTVKLNSSGFIPDILYSSNNKVIKGAKTLTVCRGGCADFHHATLAPSSHELSGLNERGVAFAFPGSFGAAGVVKETITALAALIDINCRGADL
jgi:hypothetical protein